MAVSPSITEKSSPNQHRINARCRAPVNSLSAVTAGPEEGRLLADDTSCAASVRGNARGEVNGGKSSRHLGAIISIWLYPGEA